MEDSAGVSCCDKGENKVEVGPHQGSAQSFMMDRLTEEVRQEPLYHVCRRHRDLLATAGGRGMKVTRSKVYKWLHWGYRVQRFKERERREVLRVNKECENEVKKCVQAGWNG